MDVPDGPGGGCPAQISMQPDPEGDRHRTFILRVLLSGLVLCVGIGGARRLLVGATAGDRLLGAVLALPGVVLVIFVARRVLRQVIAHRRLRTDRCIHCGYSVRGLPTTRCPECGEEPF